MRYPSAECIEVEDREPLFWIHLTEAEAQALAGGTVPTTVGETLRELLQWRLDDPTTWHPKRTRTKQAKP